jgi:Ca2+-binding RTX toxin-like protein
MAVFTGSTGADTLIGGDDNDTLTGAAANDVLLGQGGNDTAVFSGNLADYAVAWDLNAFTVTDSVGDRDGTDIAYVEFLQFTDVTVAWTDYQGPDIEGNSGDETLAGTSLSEVIRGNGGHDSILGGGGARDSIDGGEGNDTIEGGGGNDWLYGGIGNDSILGGAGNDFIHSEGGNDYVNGGEGVDTYGFDGALSGATVNLALGVVTDGAGTDTLAGIENVEGTGGNDSLVGDGGDNVLAGIGGADTLSGGAGNDTLNGGAASDVLVGGEGNDALDGGDGDFDLANYSSASAAVSVDLAAGTATGGAGNDTLVHIEAVWGSTFDDTLVGGAAADRLLGGLGNDSLAGGSGNDTLNAAGNDTLEGGDGIDTAEFSGVFLTANLETGVATSTAGTVTFSGIENLWGTGFADSLTGDAGDNTINGWDGEDTLIGGAGNDRLFGAYGPDVLIGGAGDDLLSGWIADQVLWSDGYYNVAVFSGNFADYTIVYGAGVVTVTDSVAGRDGSDTLLTVQVLQFADGSRTLFPIGGTNGNDMLFGTGLDDTLVGMAGNDTISGGAGNDTLVGGLGNDSLNGGDGIDTASYSGSAAVKVTLVTSRAQATLGAGTDIIAGIENLIGGDGNDSLAGNASANRLEGGLGSDTLDGGAGADVLIGGADDDLYWVDNAGDIVTEAADEGIDTINSAVTFALEWTPGVDNLKLTGTAANSGTGNALNNTLVGNGAANGLYGGGGNDTLDGGSGADSMAGGVGDDIYKVDNSADAVVETDGEGVDTVLASVSHVLGANVENLALAVGSKAAAGVGNGLANRITGNGLANSLNGGAGADTLDGGLGADTLTGGAGADVFRFSSALPKSIDRITDFNVADDTIELGGAFLLGGGALQVSAFQAAATSVAATAAVRIIFNTATGALLYDADGAGGGGAVQFAALTLAGLVGTVTAADFVVPDFSVTG